MTYKMAGEPENPEIGDIFISLSGDEYEWTGSQWKWLSSPPQYRTSDGLYWKKI